MKNTLLSILVLLISFSITNAQSAASLCGAKADTSWETPELHKMLWQANHNQRKTATTYYIPVVFHVVYMDTASKVADTFVHRVLDELNRKFANIGADHWSDGLDIGIQFCLAQKDTNGNPTTGITHDSDVTSNMYTYITSHSLPLTYPVDSVITSKYSWNTSHYYNIYIVRNVFMFGAAYAGYSSLPSSHGYYRDGVFLGVGYLNPADVVLHRYDIIAHETGHYLGLYHTFQFGCANNNCWIDNDRICDTPPDNYSNLDTVCVMNSCTTDADDTASRNPFRPVSKGGIGDQNDDTHNYMDYSLCSRRFTQGQRDKMVASLTTIRTSLLDSLVSYCNIHLGVAQQVVYGTTEVSPNPVKDKLQITMPGNGTYTITIADIVGRVEYRERFTERTHHIDLQQLQTGMYLYRIDDSEGVLKSGKLAKQ